MRYGTIGDGRCTILLFPTCPQSSLRLHIAGNDFIVRNFCRAFTRQSPSRVNPGPPQEKSMQSANGGIRTNTSRLNTKPGMVQDSKVNGRSTHGNRPVSGHFISSKPPRQRQMVSLDNDRAGPPGELHRSPDSNGTYVVMRNSSPKKSSTLLNI